VQFAPAGAVVIHDQDFVCGSHSDVPSNKINDAESKSDGEGQQPKARELEYDLSATIRAPHLGVEPEAIVNQVACTLGQEEQEQTRTRPCQEHQDVDCRDAE
jgi:hypothetical protein